MSVNGDSSDRYSYFDLFRRKLTRMTSIMGVIDTPSLLILRPDMKDPCALIAARKNIQLFRMGY